MAAESISHRERITRDGSGLVMVPRGPSAELQPPPSRSAPLPLADPLARTLPGQPKAPPGEPDRASDLHFPW